MCQIDICLTIFSTGVLSRQIKCKIAFKCCVKLTAAFFNPLLNIVLGGVNQTEASELTTITKLSVTTVQTHSDPTVLPLDRTMHFCRVWTKELQEHTNTSAEWCDWWDGETAAGQEGKQSHCWVTASSLTVTRSLANSRYTITHTIQDIQRHLPNSPTGSIGEDYVAFFVCLLNEGYACLLLPVTHGLLEHGPLTTWNTHIYILLLHNHAWCALYCWLVIGNSLEGLLTSEVSSDDVRNDSPGPYPFSSGCGCSRNTALPNFTIIHSLSLYAGGVLAVVLR